MHSWVYSVAMYNYLTMLQSCDMLEKNLKEKSEEYIFSCETKCGAPVCLFIHNCCEYWNDQV
uniref:Uncharacterized protein n=1 Tax=Anguilla anguilla TaxID=7936 RepID=A0A0E9SE39_ANGAN